MVQSNKAKIGPSNEKKIEFDYWTGQETETW